MKLLPFFVILSILLAGCSKRSEQSHASQEAEIPTVQADGGADGGGGNTLADPKLSADGYESLFKEAKYLLRAVLNYHGMLNKRILEAKSRTSSEEFPFDFTPAPVNTVYARLFPQTASAHDVLAALDEAKFEWRAEGACHDLFGQERDATAKNSNVHAICLSQERLKEKFTKNTAGVLALSLLGHEMVHRMGGDEEEADLFQKAIADSLASGSLEGLIALLRPTSVIDAAQGASETLLLLSQQDPAGEEQEQCKAITSLVENVNTLSNEETPLSGMRRYSVAVQMEADKLMELAIRMSGYCGSAEGVDSAVPAGDRNALSKILDEMKAPLAAVLTDLRAIGFEIESALIPSP